MVWIALAAACLAIAYAAWCHRRLQDLREDLRYVHRSHREMIAQLEAATRALKADLAERPTPGHQAKGRWFTPYMTIQDALNLHPGVKAVLAEFHIGGCASCSVSGKETLEQASQGHGVDLGALLERMNELMNEGPAPAAPADSGMADLAAAERSLPPPAGGRVMLAVTRQAE